MPVKGAALGKLRQAANSGFAEIALHSCRLHKPCRSAAARTAVW